MRKHYLIPQMEVIDIKIDTYLLAGSVDTNGMNTGLQGDNVDEGW